MDTGHSIVYFSPSLLYPLRLGGAIILARWTKSLVVRQGSSFPEMNFWTVLPNRELSFPAHARSDGRLLQGVANLAGGNLIEWTQLVASALQLSSFLEPLEVSEMIPTLVVDITKLSPPCSNPELRKFLKCCLAATWIFLNFVLSSPDQGWNYAPCFTCLRPQRLACTDCLLKVVLSSEHVKIIDVCEVHSMRQHRHHLGVVFTISKIVLRTICLS